MVSRRAAVTAAIAATLVVGVLLLVPLPAGTEELGPPQSDKLAHVGLFGGLALVWWWALRPLGGASWLWVCVMTALYGGLLELLQGLTSYRNGDWLDFAADAAGAAVAAVVGLLLRPAARRLRWES